ncbi:MAG: hypothetical protein ACKO28_03825, partial [Cyanobium sp.]
QGGKRKIMNVKDWTFDSWNDDNPVMASDTSSRWRYTITQDGFSWKDQPDNPKTPLGKKEKISFVSLLFRTRLYLLKDIPPHADLSKDNSDSVMPDPIHEKEWQSSWCKKDDNVFKSEVTGHCQNKDCPKPIYKPIHGTPP